MTGMSQSHCCCGTGLPCKDCGPDSQICCIIATHDTWTIQPILMSSGFNLEYYSGDSCPVVLPSNSTNLCGNVTTLWAFGCPTYVECSAPFRPMWAPTHHACMPYITLRWWVNSDCEQVYVNCSIYTSPSRVGTATSETLTVARNWYTGTVEFDDPWYVKMHGYYPTEWPLPAPKISFQACPETFLEFPEPDELVYMYAKRQTWSGSAWFDQAVGGGYPIPDEAWSKGNCVCSMDGGCTNRGALSPYSAELTWRYNPYTDKIVFQVLTLRGGSNTETGEGDYDDCGWPDTTHYVYEDVNTRWRIDRIEGCDDSGVGPPPPPPNKYCFTRKLCVLLEVDDEGNYAYYTLLWNGTEERYYCAEQDVPGPSGCTIEIILVEDPSEVPSGSPVGTRAWVLTVKIRDSGGTVVLEYTEVYLLLCNERWSKISNLVVPLDPEETWTLHVGELCVDYVPTPTCDPGCWPECVGCPEQKSLALVFEDAPSCCLGSYTLTYNSGSDNYTLSGTPRGGPVNVCGQILSATVSCLSSSSITLAIQFKDWDGVTKTAESHTLTTTCDGSGNMESSSVAILGITLICGEFIFHGGTMRVISL